MRAFVKLSELFGYSVECYPAGGFLASRIQVEDCLPTGLDNNAHSDIAVPLRSSFDDVRSNWQSHDLGNFVAARHVILHAFEQLPIRCVYQIRAVGVKYEVA